MKYQKEVKGYIEGSVNDSELSSKQKEVAKMLLEYSLLTLGALASDSFKIRDKRVSKINDHLPVAINALERQGLIVVDGDFIIFTDKGIMVSSLYFGEPKSTHA